MPTLTVSVDAEILGFVAVSVDSLCQQFGSDGFESHAVRIRKLCGRLDILQISLKLAGNSRALFQGTYNGIWAESGQAVFERNWRVAAVAVRKL